MVSMRLLLKTIMHDAFKVAEKYALEYEAEYENTSGEIVNIKLAYTPNCCLSDANNLVNGTELYSSDFFDATDDDIHRMLDITCGVEK